MTRPVLTYQLACFKLTEVLAVAIQEGTRLVAVPCRMAVYPNRVKGAIRQDVS